MLSDAQLRKSVEAELVLEPSIAAAHIGALRATGWRA